MKNFPLPFNKQPSFGIWGGNTLLTFCRCYLTFFVCFYLLLRILISRGCVIHIKGERERLENEKKKLDEEIEDLESDINHVEKAENLNKRISSKTNAPYNDLKEAFPEHFRDDRTPEENLSSLKDSLKEEIQKKEGIKSSIDESIEDITPTPSSPDIPKSPSPGDNSALDQLETGSSSKKRKTPSDFIDEDLPTEFPSIFDDLD